MEEAVAVPEVREPAAAPEDLGRLFLQRAGAGDVDGVVALSEIARRQSDGSWLWAADQPRVVAGA